MRALLIITILIFSFCGADAQNYGPIRAQIRANFTNINSTYESIKDLRNELNDAVNSDTIIACSIDTVSINKSYVSFQESLNKKVRILISESNWDSIRLGSALDINNSCNFYTCILALNSVSDTNYYENRLLEIDLGNELKWNKNLRIDSLYFIEYNDALHSVGRRMGRMIQSAVLEDPDYITPSSQTRLDLAISDFKLAEFNLIRALDEKENTIDTIIEKHFYPAIDTTQKQNHYFLANTDLKDYIGIEYLYAIRTPNGAPNLVGGFGIHVGFLPEGDFRLSGKMGIPVQDFQFLAGFFLSPISGENEFTGTVNYTYNKLIGGVTFSANRIFINIGFIGFD